MRVICEIAAPFVANSAADGGEVAVPFRRHVSTCLKCQARHAAMSRTGRHLGAMSSVRFPAPADLEWRVMSALGDSPGTDRVWMKPVAWSAAALSMLAAIIIWRLRPAS